MTDLFRRPLGATAGALALLALAAPHAQALTITEANVNPLVADAKTRTIIYYLNLQAGLMDERFSVQLLPPAFATKGGNDEGRAIDGPKQVTLLGDPGTLGSVITEPSIGGACSDRDEAFHGYATGSSTVDVQMTAGSKSILAVRYSAGRRPIWADTDLRLRFKIQQQLFGSYPATSPLSGAATSVDGAQAITQTTVPRLEATNKTKLGAHLILRTTPKGTWGTDAAPRRIGAKARVTVRGELVPGLSGKKVRLQWRSGSGAPRTATTVTTKARGAFRATLKPQGRGTRELWASYPNQPGPLVADSTSCPLVYRVG